MIEMQEYAFPLQRLTLRHGTPTQLHLVNRGAEIHDFTAADFFKTVDFRTPGMGSSTIGITVAPQEVKDVDLIATLPGAFGLICSDHDWAGMIGEIIVE
jgi:plastocyanin